MDEHGIELTPIAIYHSDAVNPYEAARQPREDDSRPGEIRFVSPITSEEIEDLKASERIWLVFQFHENRHWKPMVLPPRGTEKKIGVFATRAPYRPNPIGLSCVKLVSVTSLTLHVRGADLLDGTPIFEVRAYDARNDAKADAKSGWLEGLEDKAYSLSWTAAASEKLNFLRENGVTQIEDFAIQQLEFAPFDGRRKRVSPKENFFILAYRTWRILFREVADRSLEVFDLRSGYSDADLAETDDRWRDKSLHKKFNARFES